MTNVISLPKRPHVVISTALVRETQWHRASGIEIVRHNPPRRFFFLDLVEAGVTAAVWDGATYEDALGAARAWATEGVEIRDQTSMTWGRA